MRRMAGLARAGAAWLTAYVAAGGLAGGMLARSQVPFHLFNEVVVPARCWPELSLFNLIETRCESGVWNVLWFFAVGAPRLLTGVVGMALVFMADAVRRPGGFDLWAMLAVLSAASAGLVLAYWVGVSFWRRRAVWAAVVVALAVVAEHGIYIAGIWL